MVHLKLQKLLSLTLLRNKNCQLVLSFASATLTCHKDRVDPPCASTCRLLIDPAGPLTAKCVHQMLQQKCSQRSKEPGEEPKEVCRPNAFSPNISNKLLHFYFLKEDVSQWKLRREILYCNICRKATSLFTSNDITFKELKWFDLVHCFVFLGDFFVLFSFFVLGPN